MKLNYVVITSVDRDDLRDGGARHFVECIQHIRALTPNTNIEIVPRLYKEACPGADFQNTLNLLQRFKAMHPTIPTKSGLIVGLGETDAAGVF